ncbi:carotenoid oxygenase family protein [filamentous cyanobacterium LEGE 11480]|uniref:Carotenoid oxygenase family protein n=1 Tax=Romeriopsis navalis LEGE 11480 TaxID=2777977 RepID=A0A928VPV1_9CYAN|nr:carotenoid oxygenase family protein [Romeriopsis navalis]MBE9031557.1 carotenoid oxygenase family protein [Romeriopsis navalis LEGE 11480]
MSSQKTCAQKLPPAVMSASRIELSNQPLDILEGQLPDDLQGHLFFIGPVGSVESGGLPYAKGDPIFNGDGMVFRLDFEGRAPKISSSIMKTPDFYADEATQKIEQFRSLAFKNHGVSRFSFGLGMRNQLNTAFVPMQRQGDDTSRLLVTFDAGRHYEINPKSLEVMTPIGSNQEWRPETTFLSPFQPVLSTAHPVYDGATGELLTVNYGRSMSSFMSAIPWVEAAEKFPGEILKLLEAIARLFKVEWILKLTFGNLAIFSTKLLLSVVQQLEKITNLNIANFTYLMRWDGSGELERWRLVLPDGTPVKIRQSLHQIGLTQRYVILVDTSFSIGLAQVFNNPLPHVPKLEGLFRQLLSSPANPDSKIYIVRREDLQQGQLTTQSDQEVTVTVQPLNLPMEVLHFAVDYEDTEDMITLHLGHICADDAAAWIREFDVNAEINHESVPGRLAGMQTEVMDVSRLGRYEVNPKTGSIVAAKIISDIDLTWGVEFYTYANYPNLGQPVGQVKHIYWTSFGCWPELLTKFSYDLLKNYKYRTVPTDTLLDWAAQGQGKPAALFRLNTETQSIEDKYQLSSDAEYGALVNSPQFVPRASRSQAAELDQDGYIICTVFVGEQSQIWIFDGQCLSQGPICKLGHAALNFGFTLHSTWLPTLERTAQDYKIDVRSDYQSLVGHQGQKVQQLFEEQVYPHFE